MHLHGSLAATGKGHLTDEAIAKALAPARVDFAWHPDARLDAHPNGMVFGLDHRIPNGTPLEAYRHYARRGREILGLPPLDATRTGWKRMAF